MQRLRSLQRKARYTQLANDAIDALPSLDAIGLLATILRHSDAFEFDMAVLIRSKPDLGKQRAYKARKALIDYGYLVQVRFKHTYRGQFCTDIYRSAEPHTEEDLQTLRDRYRPGRQVAIPTDDGEERLVTVCWAEITSASGVEQFGSNSDPNSSSAPPNSDPNSSSAPPNSDPNSSSAPPNSTKPQVAPDSGFPEPGGSPDSGFPTSGCPTFGNPESLKEDYVEDQEEPSFPPVPVEEAEVSLDRIDEEGGRKEGRPGNERGQDLEDAVSAMLSQIPLPEHKRAPGGRSAKLQAVIDRCCEILRNYEHYGLTLDELRKHLATDLGSVRYSIVAVWSHRLTDEGLPLRRTVVLDQFRSRTALPECSECGAREGDPKSVRRTMDGSKRCPSCHPDVAPLAS